MQDPPSLITLMTEFAKIKNFINFLLLKALREIFILSKTMKKVKS